MATIPAILGLINDMDRLTTAISPYYHQTYHWPMSRQLALGKPERAISPLVGKDGFQVSMDVAHFKPSELNVRVVDNSIVVEGKHEEREDDHGYISRHFLRRYSLPKGYDPNKVMSSLSSDGVLTVMAPKPQLEDKSNERHVQIQQTGPAHLNVKENGKEEKKN
ncbi:PREDICTED: heat shock protein 23-like [Bactrocera latifrons]|uniref:Heat shock protein 23 n=1 Tax=Bactrocera latifrons TaxID=174628 RepID=A0A0K8WG10_BACLA|nr:PREDICTED: heat shock protein 23-like [Bactrocera latifrons]XP_039962933.1 heat shock protein 23-like [Bactrocera tryoni]XP_050332800.1 heat shock protein 23-like [Bactrocera neohumeralis]